jgi:hypothetical protein
MVVRGSSPPPDAGPSESRLDAEIVVGGGSARARRSCCGCTGGCPITPKSVVIPLLAPDVPVVTWWHGVPPDRIAYDPLGVVAERRITDIGSGSRPDGALHAARRGLRARGHRPRVDPGHAVAIVARQRTRHESVAASRPLSCEQGDGPDGGPLAGVADVPAGIDPQAHADGSSSRASCSLASGDSIAIQREDGMAVLSRTGLPERTLPLPRRQLGDQLAEELRHLDPDQPYSAALEAATGPDRPGAARQGPGPHLARSAANTLAGG